MMRAKSFIGALLLALSCSAHSVPTAEPSSELRGGDGVVFSSAQTYARGIVWLLALAADGAVLRVEFPGRSAQGVVIPAGTRLTARQIYGGVLLSSSSQVVAFLPDVSGGRLLYNAPITNNTWTLP